MDEAASTPAPVPISFDALQVPAEAVLLQVLGNPITIAQVTLLTDADRRNQVWRCVLANVAEKQPHTVVIKRADPVSYQPDNPESRATLGFVRDWAGAEFLTQTCGAQQHGPQFYGGHRKLGFIILEDMGEHNSLVQPLLNGTAAEATAALLAYAGRLGRMHADTLGQQDEYQTLVRAINPIAATTLLQPADGTKTQWGDMLAKSAQMLADVGIALSDASLHEAERVFDAVFGPGPFTAFVHADPCPDNVFYANGRLRLIDFEFARFGHALMDGLYGRIPFPSCWCANAIPEDIVAQMEARYRTELSRTCAAARDDAQFGAARVAVCAVWMIQTLGELLEHALNDPNAEWGIATIRARVLSRLNMFVDVAAERDNYRAFASDMQMLREKLGALWPESSPLPLYPAFR